VCVNANSPSQPAGAEAVKQVELSFSPADIERVLQAWEQAHPGKQAERDLSGEELADLMLADMKARAKVTKQPRMNQ
jgi:hypothetical protein